MRKLNKKRVISAGIALAAAVGYVVSPELRAFFSLIWDLVIALGSLVGTN